MNRLKGLILALIVGMTASACASAGGIGGADLPEGVVRPSENRYTREANREIGLAVIQPDAAQQRAHYERALQSAMQSIEEQPDNPRGWFLAGQAYANVGDYAQADAAFSKAQEIYPPYAEEIDFERGQVWVMAYNAGVEALQRNDIAEAIAQMENAALIQPSRPEARLNLGSFYANRNEPEKAIASYREALKVLRGPQSEEVPEDQLDDWKQNEQIAVFNLGQILSRLDRHAEAEAVYREYLENNPDEISAVVHLANALVQQDKIDEASAIYDDLMDRPGLDENDYQTIGVGLFQAEEFAGAARAFRGIIKLNPYSRDAYYNLAQALYVSANDLSSSREAASAEERARIEATMKAQYEELAEAAAKVVELDPLNRNIVAFMVGAYQGLANLAENPRAREPYLKKIQEAMQHHETIRLELLDMAISEEDRVLRFSGLVRNVSANAGDQIRLRVIAMGANGNVVGTEDVTVTAPAADATGEFEVVFSVTDRMAGWRYEVLD